MITDRFLFQAFLPIVLFLVFATPALGAKPYKIYVINKYGAWDIVCDSYTVKKEDHIWEILRRKGSIADKDFPRFVEMLKKMNPSIRDVNKIYPNQNIMIPLKQLPIKKGTERVPGPRYVTIPMLPDVLYQKHAVKAGESLSQIVAKRFGVAWHEIADYYKDTLKRLNPRIRDFDLIYAGDTLRIPALGEERAATKEREPDIPSPTLVDAIAEIEPVTVAVPTEEMASLEARRVAKTKAKMPPPTGEERPVEEPTAMKSGPVVFPQFDTQHPTWKDTVSDVISTVGGKLLTSGHVRFPGGDRGNVHLNLKAFPIVEFGGGKHLILEMGVALPQDLKESIRSTWRDLLIVHAEPDQAAVSVLEKVFSSLFGDNIQRELTLPIFDDGVQATLRADWVITQENGKGSLSHHAITIVKNRDERTSPAVVEYLKNRRVYVVDIVSDGQGGKAALAETSKGGLATIYPTVIDGSGKELFVSGMAEALGYFYDRQVPLSFDYAGFQVQATGNLIHGDRGTDVVVDYGTFYGDTKSAIEASGMQVLSIQQGDDLQEIARKLLDVLGYSSAENPVLLAADRNLPTTISLALPGFLATYGKEDRTLLTFKTPEPEMLNFLHNEEIETLVIHAQPVSLKPLDSNGHVGS